MGFIRAIGWFVYGVLLSVSARIQEVQQVCPRHDLSLSQVDAAQWSRVPNASHMHEEFQCVFTLDPGQSVASKGVCVYTPNRE